jgi:prohibitin 1
MSVRLGLLAAGTILLFVLTLASCSVIKPGEAGVVFNRMTGSLRTESQGAVFTFPFISTVESYPVALRTYTMVARSGEGSSKEDDSLDLPSKEGQHIKQDLSVTYNTSQDRAADVFRTFKGNSISDIENTFIRRTIITIAQNVAGQMSLVELISTKRDELQSSIQKDLTVELAKMGFVVDKVNLGAAHLPASVEQQMQQKMAAQQDAQRAEYELQKQTILAKSRIAEAEGIAKANAIIQSSLTPAILENKKIEKWDGVLPQVAGSANSVLLNLGK